MRIYDRSADPLKQGAPKLVQTLKGKNRNWPIKASFFQGRDYVDVSAAGKRRPGGPSTSRSRSSSFNGHGDRHRRHHSDSGSDDDEPTTPAAAGSDPAMVPSRPLSSSMLLACGSSDPVVLLYDLSTVSSAKGAAPAPPQRLEGHKESVYAVDFLQAIPRPAVSRSDDGEEEEAGEAELPVVGGYQGPGLLASAGGDWTVRLWKPVFLEAR